MLALILGGIYYQVVKSDNILNILKFYFISVCSAIVSILVIIKWFPEQFKGILFKLTAFGSSNRFYLWESVLLDTTSSIRRFLFGSGPSTTSINGFSAHNSFINEFSNLGFLFLISIVFYLLILAFDARRDNNFKFVAFLVVAFVIGAVESMLFVDPTMLWVGLILIKLLTNKDKELINT